LPLAHCNALNPKPSPTSLPTSFPYFLPYFPPYFLPYFPPYFLPCFLPCFPPYFLSPFCMAHCMELGWRVCRHERRGCLALFVPGSRCASSRSAGSRRECYTSPLALHCHGQERLEKLPCGAPRSPTASPTVCPPAFLAPPQLQLFPLPACSPPPSPACPGRAGALLLQGAPRCSRGVPRCSKVV